MPAGVKYGSQDVLSDPELRQGIKDFTSWPTVPQACGRPSGRPAPPSQRAGSPWLAGLHSATQRVPDNWALTRNYLAQVFIGGEFVGGSDILMGMHKDGSLEKMLKPKA